MASFGSHLDNQPIRYYHGRPIYLTHFLAVGLALGSVVTMFLQAAHFPVSILGFFPLFFLNGYLWQPFTYVFVNGIDFFTPLSLLAFFFWGIEVEKFLGRRQFLAICGALVAVPVAVCLALSFFGMPGGVQGNFYWVAGLLIAFATLYPDIDYLGGWIPLKWFAFASIAFGSISFFPIHDWMGLSLLWLNCGVAFAMVRSARGLEMPFKFTWPQRKPKLRVLPRPAESRSARRSDTPAQRDAATEMDGLLDKIARTGLQSLTAAEKARLESLRLKLLKNES